MKEYLIFDMNTDEVVGEVSAISVNDAELKFYRTLDCNSAIDMVYALTKNIENGKLVLV